MDADEENTSPRSRGVDDRSATRIESAPVLERRSARPRADDQATVLHSMRSMSPGPSASTPAGAGARPSRSSARTADGTRVLDPAVLSRRAASGREASAGREERATSEPARTGYEPTRVIGQDEIEGRERPEPISLLVAQSRVVDPSDTVVTRARSDASSRDDEATRVASLGAMAELSSGASASPGETSGEDIDIDLEDGAGPVEAAALPQSVVPTEAHRPYPSSLPPSAIPTGAFQPVPMMPPPSSVPTGGFPTVGSVPGRGVRPPSAVPTGAYPPVPGSAGPTGGHPTVGARPGSARRTAARRAAPTGIHGSIDVAHEENRRQAWGFFVGILIAIVLVGAAFGLIRLLMG